MTRHDQGTEWTDATIKHLKRRAAGLCVRCRAASPDATHCARCRGENRQRIQAARDRNRAAYNARQRVYNARARQKRQAAQ